MQIERIDSNPSPAPENGHFPKVRLKQDLLRLQLRKGIEGRIIAQFPISKALSVRFTGGKIAVLREDQVARI